MDTLAELIALYRASHSPGERHLNITLLPQNCELGEVLIHKSTAVPLRIGVVGASSKDKTAGAASSAITSGFVPSVGSTFGAELGEPADTWEAFPGNGALPASVPKLGYASILPEVTMILHSSGWNFCQAFADQLKRWANPLYTAGGGLALASDGCDEVFLCLSVAVDTSDSSGMGVMGALTIRFLP